MTADTARAARRLLQAYATGVPVAPLTDTWPGMTLADAYAVQLAQVEAWKADGHAVWGHKIGLTSAAMRRQLGVTEPDYGHLTDAMFHLDSSTIPLTGLLQPRIEPEIAFVLRRPLGGPKVTVAQAAAAVDFVVPALEVIDSRVADWKITLCDTIADNASSGAVVLGSRPTPLTATDLRLVGCTLHVNGALAATGAGGAVLGSPLNALVWLARTLSAREIRLEAGDVVLSGAMTAAQPVTSGSTVTATLAVLGSVSATFTAATPTEGNLQ